MGARLDCSRVQVGPAVACAALLTVGACSSPAAPTSSTSGLTISGTTALTPGLTSQLTATITSTGAIVSAGVTWQSQAPSVATVTATGLVTATGVGTTTISAMTSGATGHVSIVVQPAGTTTTTITACQTITAPGAYVLGGDLAPAFGPCLVLSGVAAVQLACGGHTVPGLSLSNVNSVTINNCSVAGAMAMTNVSTVAVTNCALSGAVTVTRGSSVILSDSTITVPVDTNVAVAVTAGTNVELLRDTIADATSGGSAGVELTMGANNRILQTTITGGYDGSPARVGTDDGILLENETGDSIEDNTISSFFDCAVEGVDTVASTTVANNTFSNTTSGIGSFWCTSWTGNTIQGNQVSMAPGMVIVGYNEGPSCGATRPSPVFSGNQFIGNVFRNPARATFSGPGPDPSMYVMMSGTVVGNLLQNNDFGTNPGPNLMPLAGFIDGGGNICGPLNPAISNFICTGGGEMSLRVLADLLGPPRWMPWHPAPGGVSLLRSELRRAGRVAPGG